MYVTHVVIISKLYFGRYTILLQILQMYYNSCGTDVLMVVGPLYCLAVLKHRYAKY